MASKKAVKFVPIIDSRALTLYEAKLASSGLTIEDGDKLHMEPLSAAQTQGLHKSFRPLASLKLNYMDPFGEPLTDLPGLQPFYRIRYLEQGTDFASLTEKKPVRYVQEPSTAPVAYYPLNIDWPPILDDVDIPVIITEGELKAAKACKEGFPTIGLGGVYNWRSMKLGIEWLDSLSYVDWKRRNVYICFDSDLSSNANICVALRELAEALCRKGALVSLVILPALTGLEKVGLDDFLVHEEGSADKLDELLHYAEPLGLSRTMFELNARYIYIRNPGMVVEHGSKDGINKFAPGAFKDHTESTKQYQEQILKNDGTVSHRLVAAAAEWLKWPMRYEADRMTYEPGGSGIFS